jgi:hypothetical protein
MCVLRQMRNLLEVNHCVEHGDADAPQKGEQDIGQGFHGRFQWVRVSDLRHPVN